MASVSAKASLCGGESNMVGLRRYANEDLDSALGQVARSRAVSTSTDKDKPPKSPLDENGFSATFIREAQVRYKQLHFIRIRHLFFLQETLVNLIFFFQDQGISKVSETQDQGSS